MRFEECERTEIIDGNEVGIDSRSCHWCSYEDYSARVNDVIITLAAMRTTCEKCSDNARVTVLETVDDTHSHSHYCYEHADSSVVEVAKYIDGYQRVYGTDGEPEEEIEPEK